METLLNKLRADFEVVVAERRATGDWTAQDVVDANAAIKKAIATNDQSTLGLWARWLADVAAGIVFMKLVVVPADTRIRAAIADARGGVSK